ncbi:MAG: hypothetical protein GF364_05665 [Candidatus Lokiarchaeota archaeon]|nr:hypothetical protein [Candidatus Lokiarchaeota archaeon]
MSKSDSLRKVKGYFKTKYIRVTFVSLAVFGLVYLLFALTFWFLVGIDRILFNTMLPIAFGLGVLGGVVCFCEQIQHHPDKSLKLNFRTFMKDLKQNDEKIGQERLKSKAKYILRRGIARFLLCLLYIIAGFALISYIVYFLLFYDVLIYYWTLGVPLLIETAIIVLLIWHFAHKSRITLKYSKHSFRIKRVMLIILIGICIFALPFPLIDLHISRLHTDNPPSSYDARINDAFPAGDSDVHRNGLIYPYDSIPDGPSCHAPSMIELQNGDLLCTWFAGSGEKGEDVKTYGSLCTPEYNTEGDGLILDWSTPFVVVDTINKSEGPGPMYQCPDGRIILYYSVLRNAGFMFDGWGPYLEAGWSLAYIKQIESNDNGLTWTNPRVVRDKYFYVPHGKLIQNNRGHLMFPTHREAMQYQAAYFINRDSDSANPNKWHLAHTFVTPKGCLEPRFTILESGRILCVMRTLDGRIYRSHSDTDGIFWTRPEPMRFPNPQSPSALLTLKDGRVLMMCNPQTGGPDGPPGRYRLSFILGDVNGEYWSEPYDVFTSGGEYAYPILLELKDGSIAYTYSHKRRSIGWGHFTLDALENMTIENHWRE